jgi:hypothetical protein
MIAIVSSMVRLPLNVRAVRRGCNASATDAVRPDPARAGRRLNVAAAAVLGLALATSAAAQERPERAGARRGEGENVIEAAPPPSGSRIGVGDVAVFLAGGALGLGIHESGHLIWDVAFDAGPGLKKVTFGPIPFFAITHGPLPPRRDFVVASAGFWMQHLGSEILLSSQPSLRDRRAPLLGGILAFNVLASLAYAGGAIAHAGPPERDTRSMAVFLGVNEAAVGALIAGPAVLDTVRYFQPRARWAAWASRAAKVGMVLLVLRKGRGAGR